MSEQRTQRVTQAGQPVRTFFLEVVAGPEVGRRISTDDAITVGSAEGNELVLSDPTVSRYHATLSRRGDRVRIHDHDSTNGTHVGPVLLRGTFADVKAGVELGLGNVRLRIDDGRVVMIEPAAELGALRGRSAPMRSVFAAARKVAETDASLLILGESGTGKELLARAVHDAGSRARQPFVTVDCGALSPTLVASELFGHERGAFTGADRRHTGAFERAQGGTLFLDEVGELPKDLQATLLGVLERRRVRRVGGSEEIPLDVRVLSATHRDLLSGVNTGDFRLDLFYRLAVVRVTLPPLRERPEDIPLLVQTLLERERAGARAEDLFDGESMAQLLRHPWPGNVRELRNVVLGALVLGEPPALGSQTPPVPADPFEGALQLSYREARRVVLDAFERRYLEHLLASTGSVRQGARQASMDRKYLAELLRRHGIR